LRNCGWFDVSSKPGTEYIVSGGASGSTVQVNVLNNTGKSVSSINKRIDSSVRQSSHAIVDGILKDIFDIKGLCSSKIVFCGESAKGKKEIFTCDYDGQQINQITKNSSLSVEPDWMPGMKGIVYTQYSKMFTDIVEYDITSKRSRRLAQFPGLNSCAAVSPNGQLLAVILSRDRQVELYIKSLNGRAFRRLTSGAAVEASPCWSPSGDKICFVSDKDGGRPALFVTGAGGGSIIKIPTLGSEAATPSWSLDNKIAYSARMGRNYAIAVYDMSEKEEQRVVSNAAGDWESPSWAPDSRHVVCSRTNAGKSELYIIDTWTGKMRPLLRTSMNLSMPAWAK
jgi:TolB protein